MARKSPVKNEDLRSLGVAVIVRAILDWERSMNVVKNSKTKPNSSKWIDAKNDINEIEEFFNSQWFLTFSDYDGPALFDKIKENYYIYGKCIPFSISVEEMEYI